MKKKIFISLLLTVFLSCITVTQANAVSISFDVLDSYIEVGETFDVEVRLDGEGIAEDLVVFGFDVDTTGVTSFSYTGYTIGSDFVFDDSDLFNPDNVSGSFPMGITDDYLLATLSFSADAVGTDTLSLAGLYDGMFYGLFYGFSGFDISASADITVNSASVPVPEPATFLLFAFGLAGIALNRRNCLLGL